jgi:[ribosomal protein S5]-alanine N-acetyltransferase
MPCGRVVYEKSLPSVKIRQSMPKQWSERVPPLRGDLTTLREVAVSDVHTLFTLFSDPAVTAYMAPPPPTIAKFAGFVVWSHQEREQGHGLCFGIVPDGMTAAVGILQVRCMDSSVPSAEWGFVLSAHFWSTGLFFDAADLLVEFAFTTMQNDRLEARIAQRNQRAHAAMRKLGARLESTHASSSDTGIPRDPEVVWTLRAQDWRRRTRDPRVSARDARQRIRIASEAAQSELRRSGPPEAVEPYPLFMFDRRRK